MKTRMNNFPTIKVLLTKLFIYTPFEVRNIPIENNLTAFQADKERQNFEEILFDKELAEEMFPPDYFVLVE